MAEYGVKYNENYQNALELQRLLMEDARKEDLKPIIRAGIARAYVELETLKLRIRMKPAPKAVDVAQWRAGRKRKLPPGVVQFYETDDDQDQGEPSKHHAANGQ